MAQQTIIDNAAPGSWANYTPGATTGTIPAWPTNPSGSTLVSQSINVGSAGYATVTGSDGNTASIFLAQGNNRIRARGLATATSGLATPTAANIALGF